MRPQEGRSIEEPISGFSIERSGYSISINYIPGDSIHTVFVPNEDAQDESDGHTEYTYKLYSYFGVITSYEQLVQKLILLKYSIEDEISLTNKMILQLDEEDIARYEEYRAYVDSCKSIARDKSPLLGLLRESE